MSSSLRGPSSVSKAAASTALLLIPHPQPFWQMINDLSLAVTRFQPGRELQTHLGKGRERKGKEELEQQFVREKKTIRCVFCFLQGSSSRERDAERRAGPLPRNGGAEPEQ